MSAKKFLRNVLGVITEIAAVVTSAGAANDGDIPALDSTGRLDSSLMPVGYGSETFTGTASEALAAGDFVNIYSNAGTMNVRKADASGGVAKKADGFVLAAVSNGGTATVYYGNLNNQKSGLTIGARQFLSATTPGATTETAPTTAAHIVQNLGKATSASQMIVEVQDPIVLA